MKKLSLAILMGSLLVAPSPSYADHWRRHRTVIIRHHPHSNGAAIAAGVLGGLATGVILGHVLTPPPPRPEPVYYPPPPAPRDPYDAGYSEGYSQGVARGSYERYEQARRRGYQDGYDDARVGRSF